MTRSQERRLTPHERELIAEGAADRGFTPDDEVPEPTQGPSEPGSVSRPVEPETPES